ncbi:unnamed protein product [Arctogadus glacialis]
MDDVMKQFAHAACRLHERRSAGAVGFRGTGLLGERALKGPRRALYDHFLDPRANGSWRRANISPLMETLTGMGELGQDFGIAPSVNVVKILVQVKYGQQQKYVKLDEDEGQFDFRQFHEKVIKRFACHRMLKLHTRMQQGPKLMPNIQRPRWTRQCAADSFLRSGIL